MPVLNRLDVDRAAVHATRRFGLGARPGELASVRNDPHGYLAEQLGDPGQALLEDRQLRSSKAILREIQSLFQQTQNERSQSNGAPNGDASNTTSAQTMRPGQLRRRVARAEHLARINKSIGATAPFLERLVLFWSNHFSVSQTNGKVRGIAGAFEREAIRPHILGRFADMLTAVASHPAMLLYLDGVTSVGPNSQAGSKAGLGLNENLAREILELHTVGVNGGYSQADVVNLARILTGWTVGNPRQHGEQAGQFVFEPRRHEPGDWTVLGTTYIDDGLDAGKRVLEDLSSQPATARHIAHKLAVHFVNDDPPQALVQRLSTAFLKSDGDLAEVAQALITAPDAWEVSAQKIVPPYEFVVSIYRSAGELEARNGTVKLLNALGQPLWTPPSPKGWPDGDLDWASAASLRQRLGVANLAAAVAIDRGYDPRSLAADLFGEALSRETASAISRAETRAQGFELFFMSSEFQRR